MPDSGCMDIACRGGVTDISGFACGRTDYSLPATRKAAVMRSNRLSKNEILTIPNALSLFRLLLIPVMLFLYRGREAYAAVAVLIALSALTDVVDGRIARRFHCVSDVGKVLDPIADKLTQACLFLCLLDKYPWFLWLLILFAVRELIVTGMGCLVLKRTDIMNGAMWYGKAATVLIYGCMFLLVLFPGIPEGVAMVMCAGCAGMIVLSMILYVLYYRGILRAAGKSKNSACEGGGEKMPER